MAASISPPDSAQTPAPIARGVARVRSRNDLGFVPVTTQPSWDHRALREYVIARAKGLGVADSTAELGRHVGIGRSMLSKWFSGSERPSPASLEKLAKGLNAPKGDLLALAGWVDRPATAEELAAPPQRDPLIAEMELGLSDDSWLSEEERAIARDLLERVWGGFSRHRNGRRRSA